MQNVAGFWEICRTQFDRVGFTRDFNIAGILQKKVNCWQCAGTAISRHFRPVICSASSGHVPYHHLCFIAQGNLGQFAMWSCETLRVGYEEVMADVVSGEEAELLKELEELM